MISPKSKSKKVNITVSIKNSASGEPKLNTLMQKKLQSMIIVTFTKLFVMSTVANNFSELAKRLLILISDGWLSSSTSLRSVGEREKKAISDAEANPEAKSNMAARIIARIAEKDGVVIVILLKIS